MPKRMLIDSSHPEETRVVVLDGQKVEEFDFEAATKRPLKGNIYLAKVTRVEPSLQAAFVEYGGNRQGFLAFSEIHPDYYQIPVADRLALLAEQEAEARRRSDDEFESFDTVTAPAQASSVSGDEEDEQNRESGSGEDEQSASDDERSDEDADDGTSANGSQDERSDSSPSEESRFDDSHASENSANENGETASGEAQSQESSDRTQAAQRPTQRWVRRRHYKIQEVIKRRQIILVQVVKEERGNKGAALTTYLSLAGRYCVLMPNTPRGGGISRKITNANDRKRLKSAAQALELPEGMGLIIRTAGENRTKVEIKRDYEYLLRMWDTIRELTLKSNAPACVYEEGDLIKRAIRDLYNKDVAEVIVEGEDGYRNAKDFMRMLMPSHAKNVKQYKEPVPLYQRLHIEAQLDAMFSPTVTLRSGGYIVINQTEALVAVDVNSGRATREHSIEDTAYKTNLEAAEEVARQLRLRDLAGLIVIDFIDMEDGRNDRNVEKRLRDCVKNDRARVQIGKISQFGLLEMSRQRLRAGVVAGSTVTCPTCAGQGIVRSVESTALRVLRALDEEGQRQRANGLLVFTPVEVAMYTLNQKRREIARMEQDYGVSISFQPKDDMQAGTFEMERIGQRAADERPRFAPPADLPVLVAETPDELEEELEGDVEHEDSEREDGGREQPVSQAASQNGEGAEGGQRKRRRRRRRGRDRGAPLQGAQPNGTQPQSELQVAAGEEDAEGADEDDGDDNAETQSPERSETVHSQGGPNEEGARRKRRRRRRGRRGPRDANTLNGSATLEGVPVDSSVRESDEDASSDPAPVLEPLTVEELPRPVAAPNAPSEPVWSLFSETKREAPRVEETRPEPARAPAVEAKSDVGAVTVETAAVNPPQPAPDPQAPARKGWWQRPFRIRDSE